MPSSAIEPEAQADQAVEFEALEQRVLRTVELIKQEREARARAEAQSETEAAELRNQVAELRSQAAELNSQVTELRSQLAARGTASAEQAHELTTLKSERDHVRKRVEKLLQQMDDLA